MKKLFFTIAMLFVVVVTFGQTQLPNDPSVKVGKLENGLTYYIRHNALPAERAEFYLAGYGWIPVDANAKNMNPNGDYFGKIETNEIVVNNDINIKMLGSNDSVEENIVLLQDYLWWYWITGSMSCEIYRTTGVFK